MSLAEKKLKLLQIVMDADEETTGKLVAFANELANKGQTFSPEEIAFFEKRRNEFFDSGEKGITAEESMRRLREKLG